MYKCLYGKTLEKATDGWLKIRVIVLKGSNFVVITKHANKKSTHAFIVNKLIIEMVENMSLI